MDNEVWKDIEGFEGKYQISSYGRCKYIGDKPLMRRGASDILKPRLRKPSKGREDYIRVSYSLSTGSNHKEYRAHQLVAKAFLGEQPANTIIDHKDRDPTNNRVDNLRYITQCQNMTNRTSYGTIEYQNKKYCSIYWVNKKKYYKYFDTPEEAEEYHTEMFPYYEALRQEICNQF